MGAPELFVFAGKVYIRGEIHHAAPVGERSLLFSLCALATVFLLGNELFLPTVRKLMSRSGVAKIQKPPKKKVEESKGEEVKETLSDKLKLLSASMSIQRATHVSDSTGSLTSRYENVFQIINKLLGSKSLEFKYQMVKHLKELKNILEFVKDKWTTATLVEIAKIRFCSISLGIVAQRDPLSDATGELDMFQLHQALVQLYDTLCEYVIVPNLKEEISTVSCMYDDVKIPCERMIQALDSFKNTTIQVHEIVSISEMLRRFTGSHIQDLQATMRSIIEVSDDLRSCKSILKILASIDEVSRLVEGFKLSKFVLTLKLHCLTLWPQVISGSNNSLISNELLKMHILVRQEQSYRKRIVSSIGDVALWKHFVNACDDISILAFSATDEMGFGNNFGSLLKSMIEIVGFFTSRNSSVVHTDDHQSFDNLIMEARLNYRKSIITSQSSVTLLRNGSGDVAIRIHALISKAVEKVVPGSLCSISIGTSNGVIVACGNHTDSDVLAAFVIGKDDCKILIFVANDMSITSQTTIFESISKLELDQEVNVSPPTPSTEFQDILQVFSLMTCIVAVSLPGHFCSSLSVAVENDSVATCVRNALNKDASWLLDSLSLRKETKICSFVKSTHALVAFLLPDLVIVMTDSESILKTYADKIANL